MGFCSRLQAGISYTTFSYQWSATAAAKHEAAYPLGSVESAGDSWADHSVIVTNTGTKVGDCVVTSFVAPEEPAPTGMPSKRLLDFARLKDMQVSGGGGACGGAAGGGGVFFGCVCVWGGAGGSQTYR